jgi:Zn-dependent M28 family amino/carboxypeptidase
VIPPAIDAPFENRPHPWDANKPAVVPQVVVAAEQYNRIIRLLSRHIPIELEVSINTRFFDRDTMSYNVIGEIPGTDLKDEVVMIGGCIDSWHAGTGATDNAAGTAVALEVMRILKSLDLKPRRTVRIGLWSAEEQGAFGSRAYVAAHFGKRIDATTGQSAPARFEFKPEYEKFSCYFNLDYGTGKIRGVYLQGNAAVRPIFSAWLAPFKDLGASTTSMANIGSDQVSFDEIGLPGFGFIRDFMEGSTRTAHTNMDVYDHVLEDDLKQSAVIAASFIYNAAMRDEKLPRKPLR